MNRVCICIAEDGGLRIYSDELIECFIVSDVCNADRVYQLDSQNGNLHIGVKEVTALLGDRPVGHMNDDSLLGGGYTSKRPPSTRKLEVVK